MGFDGDDNWALSDDGWNLILAGGDHVVDDFADDLEALRSGRVGFKDPSMFPALPRPHLGRYDEAFAKVFLAATRAVAAKLRRAYAEGWPYPSEGLLGSVADELATEAILVGAEAQDELRMEVLSPSRRAQLNDESETLREVSFNDRDFELLFELRKDGVLEDPGLEAQMGFLNLRVRRLVPPLLGGLRPLWVRRR
jgi:hypothetical protein